MRLFGEGIGIVVGGITRFGAFRTIAALALEDPGLAGVQLQVQGDLPVFRLRAGNESKRKKCIALDTLHSPIF